MDNMFFENNLNTDLNMYQCGFEDCKPGHSYGPAVRDHFLIHYIVSGKGIFDSGQQVYKLQAGEGFLICPEQITYYEADCDHPWSYMWVGFQGLKARAYLKKANLGQENPIFSIKKKQRFKKCIEKMLNIKGMGKAQNPYLTGHLYLFLSYLIKENGGNDLREETVDEREYVNKAVDYIKKNYTHQIQIKQLAKKMGLHRSYLYSLFSKYLNQSPQEFLINFRLDRACELMDNKNLSIGDIARSVGYKDPLAFSKIFKKKKGQAPSYYREHRPENN